MCMGTKVEEQLFIFVNDWPGRPLDMNRKGRQSHRRMLFRKKKQDCKMPKLSLQAESNRETESLLQDELLRRQRVPVVSRVRGS